MNTRLLALAYLYYQNDTAPVRLEIELEDALFSRTTELLFDYMEQVDKNPFLRPEYIFEIIKERNNYIAPQLIRYLERVRCAARNSKFKQDLCTVLLHRDDYNVQELWELFKTGDTNGNTSILGPSFVGTKSLVLQKFALCEIEELTELSDNPSFFPPVAEMARKVAEEKLPEVSTTDLLLLLNKGTKINVGKELANRTDDLLKLARI
jgi:hypothetical protein